MRLFGQIDAKNVSSRILWDLSEDIQWLKYAKQGQMLSKLFIRVGDLPKNSELSTGDRYRGVYIAENADYRSNWG